MADEDFRLRISGNADALKSVFAGISSDVRRMSDDISSQFNVVNGVFGKINAALALMSAALAGGYVFKAAVDETVKLTAESNRLARTLGTTTEEASALRMALDDLSASQPGLEVSTASMEQAADALAKRLGANEQAFRALGIQTRDTATGGFRPLLDIMLDTNARLLAMKEGADRNVQATVLYGKSWKEIQGILGLSRERMEEAREKAARLNLLVGPEGAAQVAQYRSAMNDAGDVVQSFKVRLGNLLLPVLTELAVVFGEVMPPILEAFNFALKLILMTVNGLINGFKILFQVANAVVETIYNSLAGGLEALGKALTGDFKGAWKALEDRGNATVNTWREAMDNIVESSVETNAKMERIFKPKAAEPAKKGAGTDTGGGGIYTDPKEMQARAEAEIETRRKLALEALEIEAEKVRQMQELFEIDGREAVRRLKEIEEKKLDIELKALRERRAMLEKYGANQSEIDKVNGQIQEAQARHKGAMVKISHQMTKEILKGWFSMVDAMEGAFTSTVQKMVRGQATFRDLFRNMWNAILDEFIKIQARILFEHIKGEIAKTVATTEGETTRAAIQTAGAEKGLLASMGMKAKEILMAGWTAAANAYAAISAIPVVGPFLAPAAAIAAAAAVHRMVSNLASAAGGWDNVPRDQLAMVHKNEMILPSSLAERVRNMTDTGGGKNPISVTINALDAKSVRRLFKNEGGALADALRAQARNFKGMPA